MVDRKLQEYLNDSLEVYELLKKKKQSKLESFVDFWLSGLLTLKDGLKVEGAHYLIIYKEKSLLLTIKNENVIREVNVEDKVNKNEKFRKFEYDGFIYKKYRDLKGII